MATVEAKAGASITLDGLEGREVLLYVVRGSITVEGDVASAAHLVRLGAGIG
jgi:redox-sensitive bicupin YhaK (pirin superfamily)